MNCMHPETDSHQDLEKKAWNPPVLVEIEISAATELSSFGLDDGFGGLGS